MCFGDPWEGAVPVEQVVSVGKRLFDLGASQLSLGDTIGVGTAGQVTALSRRSSPRGMATDDLAMHFHDTYGQALANTYSALQSGITTYDASAGGLGGCPYAKSATGNLATEDLVWLLNGLGIEHGVDLDALVATSAWMAGAARAAVPVGRGPRAVTIDRVSTRRVYLHVGAPKTGTTYLQDRLALNAASLRRHGYRYPTGPHQRHVPGRARPARPAVGRDAAAGRGRVGQRSCGGCAGPRGTTVVSHEILAGAKPAEAAPRAGGPLLRRGARRLQRARRRPAGRRRSGRSSSSTSGRCRSGRFLDQLRQSDQRKATRWFWRVQGLPGVLERWGGGLPPAQVHVVTVPRPGRPARGAVAAVLHRARHRPGVGAAGGRPVATRPSAPRRARCCAG